MAAGVIAAAVGTYVASWTGLDGYSSPTVVEAPSTLACPPPVTLATPGGR